MEQVNEHEHEHANDAHGHDAHDISHEAVAIDPSWQNRSGLRKFSDWVSANSAEVPPMPPIIEPAEHGHGDAHGHDAHGHDAHPEYPIKEPKAKPTLQQMASESRLIYGIVCVVAGVVLVAVLLGVVANLPIFGALDSPAINEVYARYLEKAIEETGAVNAVAGMILDYRAFDTFGESVVLFTAVLSVSFLLNSVKKNKDKKSGEE